MKNELPSDALTKPTKRLPWVLGGVGTVAIAVTAFLAGPTIAANLSPTPTPTPTVQADTPTVLTAEELAVVEGAANDQQAKITADAQAAAAAQAATLAAAHQQQAEGGPIKCAAGYSANAVDANGNESSCQKDGPGGQPCVAYNDQNQCTAWLKP